MRPPHLVRSVVTSSEVKHRHTHTLLDYQCALFLCVVVFFTTAACLVSMLARRAALHAICQLSDCGAAGEKDCAHSPHLEVEAEFTSPAHTDTRAAEAQHYMYHDSRSFLPFLPAPLSRQRYMSVLTGHLKVRGVPTGNDATNNSGASKSTSFAPCQLFCSGSSGQRKECCCGGVSAVTKQELLFRPVTPPPSPSTLVNILV